MGKVLNIVLTMNILLVLFLPHIRAEENDERTMVYGLVTDGDGRGIVLAKITFISGSDTLSQLTSEPQYGYYGEYKFYLQTPFDAGVADGGDAVPEAFTLYQNYPNPFNPATVITYELTATARVDLTVYNILGQEVRQLAGGTQQRGRHHVTWDGCDETGHAIGAGIYFYRLKTGAHAQKRKMLLLDGGGLSSATGGGFPSRSDHAAKPSAIHTAGYEIVVEKEGFETYHEYNFTLPADTDAVRKDISLTRTFSPGDYFPLEVGNTWQFLDATSLDMDIDPDMLLSEWSMTVTGTQTIDGETYYVLDTWNMFLPEIFHDETIQPLVRFDEAGYFILRYRDVDVPLYDFSRTGNDFYHHCSHENLYEYFHVQSQDILDHPEAYERFKNYYFEMYTQSGDNDVTIATPLGTFEHCRAIWVPTASKREYILFFMEGTGPLMHIPFDSPTVATAFLKRASIGGDWCGVGPEVASNYTVTDADIAEILRITMERKRVASMLYPYGFISRNPAVGTGIVISSENIADYSLLPPIPNITFRLMEYEAILEKARTDGKFLYFAVSDLVIDGMTVTVSLDCRVTPIDCTGMGSCSGQGFTYTFRPAFGIWVAEFKSSWTGD